MSVNRIITAEDLQIASRLSAIYERKKRELKLTQESVADEMGMTQPAISQQLNGKMALSTDHIVAWASILEVPPSEISPALRKMQLVFTNIGLKDHKVAVIMTICNSTTPSISSIGVNIPESVDSRSIYGVEITVDDYSPYAELGDIAVVDPLGPMRKQAKYLVNTLNEGCFLARYVNTLGDTVVFSRMDSGKTIDVKRSDIITTGRIISIATP